jgi:hypothetical protein
LHRPPLGGPDRSRKPVRVTAILTDLVCVRYLATAQHATVLRALAHGEGSR